MELHKIILNESLKKRIISAVILAPLVMVVLWQGGIIYNAVVVLAAVIMSFEWCGITSNKSMMDDKKQKFWRFSGIAYVTAFAVSLIYLRMLDNGLKTVVFMIGIVWATDIAAYFVGRIVGGPKILPAVSPNKTWAGLIGGMVAAGFVAGFVSVAEQNTTLVSMMLFGAFLAVISQVGDFFESWVKRQFDVKDSGSIIPGHGGVMDRVDGMVTVSVLFSIIALIKGGSLF